MLSGTCIEIRTKKFPILKGEIEEVVNDGMYGKGLCLYLKEELPKYGLEVPYYICEDWGWWIEVKRKKFVLGLQIYSDSEHEQNPEAYAIMSSINEMKKWSWRKFRKLEVGGDVQAILDIVERVFAEDPEIGIVKRHDDFPF